MQCGSELYTHNKPSVCDFLIHLFLNKLIAPKYMYLLMGAQGRGATIAWKMLWSRTRTGSNEESQVEITIL